MAGHQVMRFNGHTDVDLSPLGTAQMEAAAEDLAKVEFSAVYSSDLKRAMYGGDALVRNRDIKLEINPSLREIFFGDWEGLTFDDVESRYPGALEARRTNLAGFKPPGGETIKEFWDRINSAVTQILFKHRGSNVAIAAHSAVNRVILLQALGCPLEKIWRIHQDYGCLNIVDYYEEDLCLVNLVNGPNRVQGK